MKRYMHFRQSDPERPLQGEVDESVYEGWAYLKGMLIGVAAIVSVCGIIYLILKW